MTNDLAIRILGGAILGTTEQTHEAVAMAIKALSALPSASDLIDRQAAINAINHICPVDTEYDCTLLDRVDVRYVLLDLPSAQPEPLTDKEQRIFLAVMERMERVCEEVDKNSVREPYEDSLVWVCKEVRRKVKDALWT